MLMDIQQTEYLPGCGAMNEVQPMRADTPQQQQLSELGLLMSVFVQRREQ